MESPEKAIRLAILDDYQKAALRLADWESLGQSVAVQSFHHWMGDEDELAEHLCDFDIVVAMRERTRFTHTLFERLPKLKLLVTTGMRNVAIDVAAANQKGVLVTGTSLLTHPTVELTWGLILSLARNIPLEHQAMREGRWQTTLGIGLNGKVLGVVGLGKLGSEVARIGKAFGMEVIAWSQNLTAERAEAVGARLVDKEELFRSSHFVTIHLVLSARTRGLVGESEIELMRPFSFLINTSRGPIVDEAALIAALEERRIAGAGLDVYDQEPLPPDHPFRQLTNMVHTPHLGYVTAENYRRAYGEAVEDVRAFLAGKPIRVVSAD